MFQFLLIWHAINMNLEWNLTDDGYGVELIITESNIYLRVELIHQELFS
jgi:hypothetical protein